jgi:Oxidoreductase FAD-binding domain
METTAIRGRLSWQAATVVSVTWETASVATIVLDPPGWSGHRAGQHLDVRLTAEDGYSAERSYSIASAPGEPLAITVERLEDGEVSPYLAGELRAGDELELPGPIGGYFVWEPGDGGPLTLLAGGSGVVPLRSMLRHRRVHQAGGRARRLPASPGRRRPLPDVRQRPHGAGQAHACHRRRPLRTSQPQPAGIGLIPASGLRAGLHAERAGS